MVLKPIVGVLGIAALLALMRTSEAAVISYTSRAAWEADVGPLSGTEDFNSFTEDTQFRTSSVALNNMTLSGEAGNQGDVANKIDTPVFEDPKVYTPLDIDGTNFVFGDLALFQEMEFDMTVSASAWGVDTAGIANTTNMGTTVLLYDESNSLIGSQTIASSGTADAFGFIGFRTTGADIISRVVFTNTSVFFDFFGLDNIGFVTGPTEVTPLPEPSSLVLMGLGALGCIACSRRRRHGR